MKAVLGIGNPGARYESTRHNVGFWVIDALAEALKAGSETDDHGADVRKTSIRGEPVLLLKPRTYVNLSGQSVRSMVRKGLDPADLLVITDDINLPVARIRVRAEGGDGGHKGLRSIIETLGHSRFPRVRVGVGTPPRGLDAADYVLAPVPDDEMKDLSWAVEECAKAVAIWLRRNDLSMMMNRLNKAQVPSVEDSRSEQANHEEEDV